MFQSSAHANTPIWPIYCFDSHQRDHSAVVNQPLLVCVRDDVAQPTSPTVQPT